MKKLSLLLTVISFTALSAMSAEPLLLEPLSPVILSTTPVVQNQPAANANGGLQVTIPGQEGVDATFFPVNQISNMIPQNAAAEGKPVPQKQEPRVKVRTKQRSQGNSCWNAGGKGTKSYF